MLKYYFQKAKKEKWGIGQFNFTTIEQLKAIIEASKELKSPVILGTSKGESSFFGLNEAALIVSFYKKKYKLPIFLNLDHGKDLELIKSAIDAGYDMVHFDGSEMNIKDNIELSKKVLKYAQKKNVLVEGEIGHVPGASSFHKTKGTVKEIQFTSLEEATYFSKETGVDLLAISIGNIHGVYSKMPEINFNLLKEVSLKTKPFLVFHGSSGFSSENIKKAIKLGIVKINVNTDLRIAWKKSLENTLKMNKKEFTPYNILKEPKIAVLEEVKNKIKLFGSRGKAR